MSRDRTARTRVREYLRTHGSLQDPTGYATSALKEAIEYRGTAVAFIQLIAAMDREGEIAREIRGKRTYRITLGHTGELALEVPPAVPAASSAAVAPLVEVDYDRLARALVREFFRQSVVSANAVPRNVLAQRPVAGDPAVQLRAERDEYALLLEIARLRLGALLREDAEDGPTLLRRLSA